MSKSSAIAHSNIALIKYWGRSDQADSSLNLPSNDSISMTKLGLSDIKLETHTTIEFSDKYSEDSAELESEGLSGRKLERILRVVDPLRKKAGINLKFKMVSKNDFPTQAGLASSAAGFAALAIAASSALKLKLSKEQISTYARLGSGSAARSIHGGFVRWHKGNTHETSYADQICGPNDFQMNAVIAVVSEEQKKITSDVGHESAKTSPFNEARISVSHNQVKDIIKAIKDNNFARVGKIAEASCKYMHAVMMTSEPSLFYWQPATIRVIHAVQKMRAEGLESYFTIDAGPNVHCFCRPEERDEVQKVLEKIEGVKKTIPVKPAEDSFVTKKHLF